MQVLLKPGDHAIVLTPNYQSAETVPLSICEVSGVALDATQGWTLDVNGLRDAIRPNTRLVSINFPNNPTGAIPSKETLIELTDLCRDKGLWLFSDEVYRGVGNRSVTTHRTGCRHLRKGTLTERDVQSLRPARPAHRLDSLSQSRSAAAHGTLQTLSFDLQFRTV